MKQTYVLPVLLALTITACSHRSNRIEQHIDSIIAKDCKELADANTDFVQKKDSHQQLTDEEELAKKALEFRKDSRYETEGFYYAPGQTIGNSDARSLMAQVGERGTLIVSALFPSNERPSHIKIEAGNDNYIEYDVTPDMRTVGNKIVVGYSGKESYDIINFVIANKDKQIMLQIDGYKNVFLTSKAIDALVKVGTLYDAIRKRQDNELMMKNDSIHIKFMERKIKEDNKLKAAHTKSQKE